jgi:uncharacterized protein HemX
MRSKRRMSTMTKGSGAFKDIIAILLAASFISAVYMSFLDDQLQDMSQELQALYDRRTQLDIQNQELQQTVKELNDTLTSEYGDLASLTAELEALTDQKLNIPTTPPASTTPAPPPPPPRVTSAS